MLHFEQGKPGQLPEITAFAGRAFEKDGRPEDFPALLPGMYGPGAQSEKLHTLLYDEERLLGLFAMKIVEFTVAGRPLRAGWIGTVAVGREDRGRGHLARLMERANGILAQSGCALGVLGGLRHRYRPFGYEFGGSQWQFTVDARGLRGVVPQDGLVLEELREKEEIRQARLLFLRQPVSSRREEGEFLSALRSWGSMPLAVRYRGRLAGYAALNGAGQVGELALEEPGLLPGVLALLRRLAGKSLTVTAGPWAGPCQQCLAELCESARLVENHSYRVLEWEPVLNAALALRRVCGPALTPGLLEVAVEGQGAFSLTVEKTGEGVCRPSEAPAKGAVPLTHHQAVRLLLGADSPLASGFEQAPAGWLPLPFALPWQDGI